MFIIHIAISITIIFSIHYLYNYVTVKSKKALVNNTEKYKKLMDEIQHIKSATESSLASPFKDEKEKKEMNDELTDFINCQFAVKDDIPM